MARTPTLTDAKVKALQPKETIYYESVAGLPLRLKVTPAGTKAFVAKWRIYREDRDPEQVVFVVGTFPVIGVEEASELTRTAVTAGKAGIDQRRVWEAEERAAARAFAVSTYEADGDVVPDDKAYLKNAWDAYAATKIDITKRHELNIARLWKHVAETLPENIKTADLTTADISKIKKKLSDRPQEFNKFRMTLSGVLDQENFEGRIERNVLTRVSPFPLKYRDTILSDKGVKDFKKFYSNLDNFKPLEHNHARFLLCLLYTGLRPSMLRSLRKEDDGECNFLDISAGTMMFRSHKTSKKSTKKVDVVNASTNALEIMRAAMFATSYSPYVFGSHDNRESFRNLPLSEKRTQIFFRKHAHRFEVEGTEKFEIYTLRHTFGTLLVNNNVPLHQVAAAMLHTTILTTQRYVKTTEKTRKTVADIVDSII